MSRAPAASATVPAITVPTRLVAFGGAGVDAMVVVPVIAVDVVDLK